jgi:hypothetical protein
MFRKRVRSASADNRDVAEQPPQNGSAHSLSSRSCCDELAALAAKVNVAALLDLLSSHRHGIVTETPTLAGV